MKFPLELAAIKIKQPLGEFFAVSIPASILLDICYTIRIEVLDDKEESAFGFLNKITGTQRETKISRLDEIKNYSETVDATFPNSIILGANYDEETGLLIEKDEDKWYVKENGNGSYILVIPSERRLASIIDGQHRLYGFKNSSKKDMELLCSVFLELPMAYHAKIFMNINMNQKRVDKNLAYNLFHFEIEPGNMKSWSPDTLSVYFTRILGTSEDSPFNNKLNTVVTNDKIETTISFASVIDGIISLISNNPRKDRDHLHKSLKIARDRNSLAEIKSTAPFRTLYVYNKDKTLYTIILNFLKAFNIIFWENSHSSLIMKKTLGIQSIFDFFKIILTKDIENQQLDKIEDINEFTNKLIDTYTVKYFLALFDNAKNVNLDDQYFGVQSKARTRIKNTLMVICNIETKENIKIYNDNEKEIFYAFLKKYNISS